MERRNARLALPFLLVGVLLTAGCTTARLPPMDQQNPAEQHRYIIAPGDALSIFVRNRPELSISVPVRPDGLISTPLIQNMQAAGKTAEELAEDIEEALKKYVRYPMVTVMVGSFTGTYSNQVKIIGEAVSPMAIPYRDGMTLLDLMIAVGGLSPYAAGNRAKLVRQVNGERKVYGLDIADLVNGDIEANVKIRPGDVIIIPRSFF